jgi:hypothetical protein
MTKETKYFELAVDSGTAALIDACRQKQDVTMEQFMRVALSLAISACDLKSQGDRMIWQNGATGELLNLDGLWKVGMSK